MTPSQKLLHEKSAEIVRLVRAAIEARFVERANIRDIENLVRQDLDELDETIDDLVTGFGSRSDVAGLDDLCLLALVHRLLPGDTENEETP